MTETAPEQDRVIWRSDLCKQLDVCSETIRRYMRDEKLPKPDVELSRRTMGWKLSTLRAAGINL
jgi:predicted DNA-binding transcriptional regulator AlpA